MTDTIEIRVISLADYILDQHCTVRAAAKEFGISKSTVHSDLSKRLPHIDGVRFAEVQKVLDYNLSQRHLRGGESTRLKYLEE